MKKQINEVLRMQKLAGIIKENYEDDFSGYSYEYKEGQGASPQDIASAIKQYQSDKFTWEKLAKNDFYAMAQGEAADIKSEYYPEWKKEDFQKVINAVESSSLNEIDNDSVNDLVNLLNQNIDRFEKLVNIKRKKQGKQEMSIGDFEEFEGEDGIAVDSFSEPGERGTKASFSFDKLKVFDFAENDIEKAQINGKTIYYIAWTEDDYK